MKRSILILMGLAGCGQMVEKHGHSVQVMRAIDRSIEGERRFDMIAIMPGFASDPFAAKRSTLAATEEVAGQRCGGPVSLVDQSWEAGQLAVIRYRCL